MSRGPHRGLAEAERAVLAHLPLPLDGSRVQLYRLGCAGPAGLLRRLVLRLSRERAIALGNRVFLPARCEGDLAVLAHELTHCAQFQAWGPLRYYARGAATQVRDLLYRMLGVGKSQYDWRPEPGRPFESYGMEQQGQIVEDAVRGHLHARELIDRCLVPR
jgi:hypothetical protein